MKRQLVLALIITFLLAIFIYSQEQIKPFIISPFIGEKLDKIEENYFHIFPAITSFQEATFYLNLDSSITLNLKFKKNNQLIDTTTLYPYSLTQIRRKINQVLLTDIKSNKVEEIEFSDPYNSYEGTVYSFDGKQIRLIGVEYDYSDNAFSNDNYLLQLNYDDIRTITISESSTTLKIMSSLLGMLVGGLIGSALTPEPKHPETFPDAIFGAWEDASKSMANTFIGIGVGGLLGFIIGGAIEVPVEYNVISPGTKTIIYENSLLSKGK